jgi:hypothetical protein
MISRDFKMLTSVFNLCNTYVFGLWIFNCDACRPFDATGKDRQVSEQPVAYHRINILQRKNDTGYRPHWYDTEIRNKSGPGFRLATLMAICEPTV